MKEYYSEVMDRHFPSIKACLEADEQIQMRFVGKHLEPSPWAPVLLTGLYVVTDKNLYFCGKAGFQGGITSSGKSGTVIKIPLNTISYFEVKKNSGTLKYRVDFMGPKYQGKQAKVKFEILRGKEGKK